MPTDHPYLHRAATARPYSSTDGGTCLARTALREIRGTELLGVLSEQDFGHRQTYGQVVVKQAVSIGMLTSNGLPAHNVAACTPADGTPADGTRSDLPGEHLLGLRSWHDKDPAR